MGYLKGIFKKGYLGGDLKYCGIVLLIEVKFMNEKLWGLLIAICLALASFSLKFAFDANARIQSMEATNSLRFQQVQQTLEALANDKENDIRQDKTLSKLWKISTWNRDQINILQFNSGKVPVGWPDLGE